MDINNLIVILIIVIVFLVAAYISFSKNSKSADISKDIKSKLSQIPVNSTNNLHELKSVLIEHDKLLDYYLKRKNFRGETMGERLKNARKSFDKNSYNKIWIAHKLRNQLVHELNSNITSEQIKQEIYNLRKVLEKIQ